MPIALALDAAIALFKRYRGLILPIGAAIALGLLWIRGNHYRSGRDEARKVIAQMELASKQAREAQIALNKAAEASYRAKAEETDREHQRKLESYRSASDRHAAANGVRKVCASLASAAGATAEGNAAQGDNGPGADAIVLSRADFDTLNENTLRLQAVHEWGEGLIEAGLADKP